LSVEAQGAKEGEMKGEARQARLLIACVVTFALLVFAAGSGSALGASTMQLEAPTLTWLDHGGAAVMRTSTLSSTGVRLLAATTWWGGRYTVGSGQAVTVFVSATYARDESNAREWASWFTSLPHGHELGLLTAYVATLGEVEEICGAPDVLGCYWGQKLVTIGDSSAGIPPASVAAHEYGHHIASNRINPPWAAIDWGTKRWSSYMGICTRVGNGLAFPGDEGPNYVLNPGEGFAEAYRVLVETNGTAQGFDWPVVDASFRPDATALAAVRDDVLRPWAPLKPRIVRGTFARGSRTWRLKLSTPLDGDLRVSLAVGSGGANEVTLLAENGNGVIGTGSWDSSGGVSVQRPVCGTRSTTVRVTRRSTSRRFTLRLSVP
jgi:hypothetical protein